MASRGVGVGRAAGGVRRGEAQMQSGESQSTPSKEAAVAGAEGGREGGGDQQWDDGVEAWPVQDGGTKKDVCDTLPWGRSGC